MIGPHLFDSLLCTLFLAERDEAVAAVHTRHGVHHQPQVPDLAAFLKQWDQLVLKDVFGNFATKNLE